DRVDQRHQAITPLPERSPIRVRDAEQLADHERRERVAEVADQLNTSAAGGQIRLVEYLSAYFFDAGTHAVDKGAGERSAEQPLQTGVLRWALGDQVVVDSDAY